VVAEGGGGRATQSMVTAVEACHVMASGEGRQAIESTERTETVGEAGHAIAEGTGRWAIKSTESE
jgi:hypothetical protein